MGFFCFVILKLLLKNISNSFYASSFIIDCKNAFSIFQLLYGGLGV